MASLLNKGLDELLSDGLTGNQCLTLVRKREPPAIVIPAAGGKNVFKVH